MDSFIKLAVVCVLLFAFLKAYVLDRLSSNTTPPKPAQQTTSIQRIAVNNNDDRPRKISNGGKTIEIPAHTQNFMLDVEIQNIDGVQSATFEDDHALYHITWSGSLEPKIVRELK